MGSGYGNSVLQEIGSSMAEMARRLRVGLRPLSWRSGEKKGANDNLFFKVQDILLGLLSLRLCILAVEGSLYLR
jgi:hypothetical protein